MYELLRNFVSREDFPRLIRILSGIHDGTLKDKCSVLVLTGGHVCGMTTLRFLIQNLCRYSGQSVGRIPPNHRELMWRDRVRYELSKGLVISPEIVHAEIPEMINNLHEDCNNFKFTLQQLRGVMMSVGLVLCGYNSNDSITEIKTKPGDKRLPIYLHLPNKQKVVGHGESILNNLTTEFYQIRETINNNVRHEAYWRYICRLSPIFKHLLRDLKQHILSQYLLISI